MRFLSKHFPTFVRLYKKPNWGFEWYGYALISALLVNFGFFLRGIYYYILSSITLHVNFAELNLLSIIEDFYWVIGFSTLLSLSYLFILAMITTPAIVVFYFIKDKKEHSRIPKLLVSNVLLTLPMTSLVLIAGGTLLFFSGILILYILKQIFGY